MLKNTGLSKYDLPAPAVPPQVIILITPASSFSLLPGIYYGGGGGDGRKVVKVQAVPVVVQLGLTSSMRQ